MMSWNSHDKKLEKHRKMMQNLQEELNNKRNENEKKTVEIRNEFEKKRKEITKEYHELELKYHETKNDIYKYGIQIEKCKMDQIERYYRHEEFKLKEIRNNFEIEYYRRINEIAMKREELERDHLKHLKVIRNKKYQYEHHQYPIFYLILVSCLFCCIYLFYKYL